MQHSKLSLDTSTGAGADPTQTHKWLSPWTWHWTAITFWDSHGHFPSCKVSPPSSQYQITLWQDKGTRVRTTCPDFLNDSEMARIRTNNLSLMTPNHYTTTTVSTPFGVLVTPASHRLVHTEVLSSAIFYHQHFWKSINIKTADTFSESKHLYRQYFCMYFTIK